MNKNQIFISAFLFFTISILFFQCKKHNEDIGIDLIDENTRIDVNFIDTITVEASTAKIEKIETNDVVHALVGSYTDPVFGATSASFVTQLLMSNNTARNDSIVKDGITVDSLVIYLQFPTNGTQVYGNMSKECQLNISKINKFLNKEEKYYSNYDVNQLTPELISSYKFTPKKVIDDAKAVVEKLWQQEIDSAIANKEDTSKITKKTPNAMLAIHMPDELRDEVYAAIVKSLKNNATFVEEFNGLYFSTSDESKNTSISIFNYASDSTRAVLYYHKNTKPEETEIYTLPFNQYATHFNIFEHQFSDGNILADLSENANQLDTVVYLQGIGGLNTRIKFPHINEMVKQGRWAVTKAQIILSVPQDASIEEKQYPAPEELMLYRIDENGEETALNEFYSEDNSSYLGELYTDNQYIFDITLFMQRMLKGDYANNELLLKVKHGAINPARVVVAANGNSRAIKLQIVASRI